MVKGWARGHSRSQDAHDMDKEKNVEMDQHRIENYIADYSFGKAVMQWDKNLKGNLDLMLGICVATGDIFSTDWYIRITRKEKVPTVCRMSRREG